MDCKRCDELLADYMGFVGLFRDGVRKFPGVVGDDVRLAAQNLGFLRQKCKAASGALMEHWRQDHRGGTFRLALREMERLRQACRDADDALMAHLHQEHNSLTRRPSSS